MLPKLLTSIFGSRNDRLLKQYRGVVAFVRVVDGSFAAREPLRAMAQGTRFESEEAGFFSPTMVAADAVTACTSPTACSAAATTVVARTISGLTDFEGFTPAGRTIQEKLTNLGIEIVERFVEDTLDLTRATIAEARRFPELSRNVHDAARDRAAGAVLPLLNEATQRIARSPKGPFSAKRSVATAQMFMDLILLPMLMRSLMGEDLKDLKKELPTFLHERVNFFLAACEADWRP